MPSVPASNHLLAGLAVSDFALLQPHLEATDLPLRRGLEYPNKPIQHVYFVERGIVSVVAGTRNDGECEIGIVGREGMTGIQILVGSDRSPHQTYVQVAGHALRIEAVRLRKIMEESARLRNCLLLFVPAFMAQTAQTAVANGRAKLEQRLARWLLMAHDRVRANTLPLTHEFLSLMLGVRRAGVTDALNDLERKKLIRTARGEIVVLDRKGIERTAGGTYGTPEAEFRRLIG